MNASSPSKLVKVAISFLIKDSDAKLVVASGQIIEMMTGNATYPTPLPTLAVVTTARNSYVAAVNALDRGKVSINNRDQTRVALVLLLRELALYVQQASQGNLIALVSSGFPAQKGRGQPVGVLLPPRNVRLRKAPLTGQMLARCDRVPSGMSYQWRYATALAPTVWTQADAVSTASFTLESLVPGTQYLVQARVFGTKGPSNWSDSASLIAT